MTDAERARWERETYEPAVRRAPERKHAFLAESGAPPPPSPLAYPACAGAVAAPR